MIIIAELSSFESLEYVWMNGDSDRSARDSNSPSYPTPQPPPGKLLQSQTSYCIPGALIDSTLSYAID